VNVNTLPTNPKPNQPTSAAARPSRRAALVSGVLLAFAFICVHSCSSVVHASLVTFIRTNSVGQPDTNSFKVVAVSQIYANGTFTTVGVPQRITPGTDGRSTNYFAANNYYATNYPSGPSFTLLFQVPDNSSNVINAGDYQISGANYFVTRTVVPTGVLTNGSSAYLSGLVLKSYDQFSGIQITNGDGTVNKIYGNGSDLNLVSGSGNLLLGSMLTVTTAGANTSLGASIPTGTVTYNGNGSGLTNLQATNITGLATNVVRGANLTNANFYATALTENHVGWNANGTEINAQNTNAAAWSAFTMTRDDGTFTTNYFSTFINNSAYGYSATAVGGSGDAGLENVSGNTFLHNVGNNRGTFFTYQATTNGNVSTNATLTTNGFTLIAGQFTGNGGGLTNVLTVGQSATLANAVTNRVIILNNTNALQNFVGLPMTRIFKKLVVAGDSKSCTLYTNGWYSYGGYTNSGIASTATNQLDGTLQFNIGGGSYLSNNISFWAVLTNRIGANLGYPVALDTAMCVPGTSLGNIIAGYPTTTNVRAIGSGFQQFYGKPITNSADGTVTNAFGFYAGLGPITLYSSNMVAYGSIMARDTNLTGVIYQGVTYTVTNGAPITITPTNTQATKGYTSVIIKGTPNYRFNLEDSYTLYPGAANNYFPPYSGSSVANSTNNPPPINWLFTNAPALTGVPTAFGFMCGGNDVSVVMAQTYETNQTVILMAATNIYNLAVATFQLARSNGYYPNILAIYPTSYSFTALGSQYQVMTNYNNLLRQMPVSLVDVIVDLDAAAAAKGIYSGANPSGTNYLGGSTTSLGDGVHYSLAYTTEQGELMFTNSYLSTLTPLAGWVPSGATPPSYSGLWNSNGLGAIYYIRAGVKTNYITGP
jgi:hypothetical protein